MKDVSVSQKGKLWNFLQNSQKLSIKQVDQKMYGAIELYKKAQTAEIKPIIGVEFYLINGDITKKIKRFIF